MTKAHFVPMEFENCCGGIVAYEVSPDRRATWYVGEMSDSEAARFNCNPSARDLLRYHPNAPLWVQAWIGPFEIYVFNEK